MTNETAPERIWFNGGLIDIHMYTSLREFAGGTEYVRADAFKAAQARIAELEGALRKIGNQKPNFDYAEVPAGEKLEVNNMRPGSPYDRGMDEAYKTLTKMARAALEGKGCS